MIKYTIGPKRLPKLHACSLMFKTVKNGPYRFKIMHHWSFR
jgi:hypothetical protein